MSMIAVTMGTRMAGRSGTRWLLLICAVGIGVVDELGDGSLVLVRESGRGARDVVKVELAETIEGEATEG